MKFTLNRSLPIGGFANGILVNALIGLPLCDRRYFPTNLLPFDSETRKSLDAIVQTKLNVLKLNSKITAIRLHISNDTRC